MSTACGEPATGIQAPFDAKLRGRGLEPFGVDLAHQALLSDRGQERPVAAVDRPPGEPAGPTCTWALLHEEQPVVHPDRPVEPKGMVEAGQHHPRRTRFAMGPVHVVDEGDVGGVGDELGVQGGIVGYGAIGPDPHRIRLGARFGGEHAVGQHGADLDRSLARHPLLALLGHPADRLLRPVGPGRKVFGRRNVGHGVLMIKALFGTVKGDRRIEDGATVLDRHHPARRERPAVADAVDGVDDRHVGVAAAKKEPVERVDLALVDRALRRAERLGGHLPTEQSEPVGALVLAAENVGVDPLEIEDVEQSVQCVTHGLHGRGASTLSVASKPEEESDMDEEIIEPERPIVDPHHHLWYGRGVMATYLLEDLWADTGSGHNIVQTVFVECRSEYRSDGPKELRPVGETEFVADQAAQSAQGGPGKARIAAIVAHADLRLGDRVEEVLARHEEAGQGLFRGIRHAGSRDADPDALMIPGRAPEGLYQDAGFLSGLKRLGQLGYTYDTWHYHHQNLSFATLARAVPGTTMVLDHFGTPLGVGRFAGRRAEIFEQWKKDVAVIAECPNVIAKLGGLAMPDNGFGWTDQAPSSDEFAGAQAPYYLHMIECFTPERCMFESNFPVDKLSIPYLVLWNGLKKIVRDFSEDEKDMMFRRTASRVYRL